MLFGQRFMVMEGEGTGGAGGGATGTGDPGAGGNTTPPAWYEGFAPEMKGYIQNKGFKDPADLATAYQNLEKLRGVPQERLLTLPAKDDDAAGWEGLYNRLGRPAKAEEYKLPPGDENFSKWAKDTFHKIGLTAKQAESLSKEWGQYGEKLVSDTTASYEAKVKAETDALKKEWGAAFDQEMEAARTAYREFGITDEVIDKLEDSMGYAAVMKLMNSLGKKVGEHSFVHGDRREGFKGSFTPSQAQAKITALRQDQDFVSRYVSGDTKAREEMETLHKYAYPDAS